MKRALREQIEQVLKLGVDLEFLLEGAARALTRKAQARPLKEQIDFIRRAHEDDELVTALLRMHVREAELRREQLKRARKRKWQGLDGSGV